MRDNESSRTAAVAAAAQAGDTPGMVEALMGLWVQAPERESPTDPAAAEAWQAIVRAGAARAAAEAGLRLVHSNVKLRPHAFIDLTEQLEKDELLELVPRVIERRWEIYPYLATVLARLIEKKHTKDVTALLARYGEQLATTPEGWLLVAFVLTTSLVGDRVAVGGWFADWEQRRDVPMWILAAYLVTISQEELTLAKLHRLRLDKMIAIARRALEVVRADETAPYLIYLTLIDDLRGGRDAEALATFEKHRELLARQPTASLLDLPLTAYANGIKHVHPVNKEELERRRYMGTTYTMIGMLEAAADARNKTPVNLQLAEVIAEIGDFVDAAGRIFALYFEMRTLGKGDPKTRDLMREMSKARPSAFPWIVPAWRRLVRARVPWAARARFALFG